MADTIQEYLVRLGFQVDQSQQNRFIDGLKSTRTQMEGIEKVVSKSIAGFYELATAAGGTAIAIATALGKIALGMAQMSFQAQRVGASAANIHALGFAFTQAGGSIEDANSALESYSTLLRELPGHEQSIKQQFNIPENVTDRAEQLALIGAELRRRIEASGPEGSIQRSMETAAQSALAQKQLGYTQDQFLKSIRPQFNPAFNQARETEQRIGVNWDEAARKGAEYRKTLTDIYDEFDNLKKFVYNEFADGMNTGLRKVSDYLKAHDRDISDYIRNTRINFEGMTKAVSDWYDSLSKKQQEQVKTGAAVAGGAAVLGGGAAALGGLLSFFRIPGAASIARLGALTAAIGLLTNDYQTWKRTEGKEGLIDWSNWEGPIDKATAALKFLHEDVIKPMAAILGVPDAFVPVFEGLVAFLIGSRFLGVLKTSGLWAFFAFLRNPAAMALAAIAGVAVGDAELKETMDEAAKAQGFEKQGGSLWNPFDKIPTYTNPRTGETLTFREMQDRLGIDPVTGRLPRGSSGASRNFEPAADTAMPEERRRFLDALSIGESGGSYSARNPDSTAHGRYQFLNTTDAEVSAQTGLPGQDKVSQDRKAWFYAESIYRRTTGRDLAADLKEGGHAAQIAAGLRGVWPSLPGGSQQNTTMEQWLGRMSGTPTTPKPGPAQQTPSPVGDMINRLKDLGGGAVTPMGMTNPAIPPPNAFTSSRGDVSVNNTSNISVSGVSDPQLAANHVERASERQNADIYRRLRPIFA